MANVVDSTVQNPARTFAPGGYSRLSQILEKIPLSRSAIYRMIEDDRFPKQRKLGLRASVWRNDELNAYLADKLGA